jgi:hypothetical protein
VQDPRAWIARDARLALFDLNVLKLRIGVCLGERVHTVLRN